MNVERRVKKSFAVIGKEGSTRDGEGFIRRLWDDANGHFEQVSTLAKRDDSGNLVGIWGTMSDFSRAFMPWDDYNSGLYLAGVECVDGAEAPDGWTKWIVPGYEYLCARREDGVTFADVLEYMKANGLALVGAAHDFNDPRTGWDYMFFPIRRL